VRLVSNIRRDDVPSNAVRIGVLTARLEARVGAQRILGFEGVFGVGIGID